MSTSIRRIKASSSTTKTEAAREVIVRRIPACGTERHVGTFVPTKRGLGLFESHALEPAGLLVDADGLAGPGSALDARELARTVLAVGLGGRKAQHGQIVGLGFH